MEIEDHKLVDPANRVKISFEETPNVSGPFENGLPDTIVIHYTAGSSLNSSARWLKNPKAIASAHLIIGKTGEIIQLVPFNIRAWHAGNSSWKGRSGLNRYSIGIEIDNAGPLTRRADGFYTWFDKKVPEKEVVLAKHKHEGEEKAWEAYPSVQIEMVEEVCMALMENYHISEILGHEDIAPQRKRDPGPAFPLAFLQSKVLLGRREEGAEEEEEGPAAKGVVTADYLNIRSQPSGQASLVSDPFPKGTRLKLEKTQDDWVFVKTEVEGWMSRKWIRTV